MAKPDSSKTLDEIIQLIPGYDPVATAGDCRFDREAAQFAIDFFAECLTFTKGAKAKQPFLLELWQQAVVANLFGWKRPDGTRRYREALIFVPRKNGKTEMAGGITLLILYTDGEPGAEAYSAAADEKQAAICFAAAKTMILQDPDLLARAEIYKHSIVVDGGSYQPVTKMPETKHGANAHLVVNDELHAQATRELTDVLMTSTASRDQPLALHLSTSDFEREGSICNEKHDYACKVRDAIIDDAAFLPVIYEASKDDDWKDPATWKKANPNLGVSISEEYLSRECGRAREEPAYENTFKRLHLNIRTEQAFRWMPMDKWDACAGEVAPGLLEGAACCGGLDLATVSDMAALVLAFEVDGEYHLLPFYWCPEETAELRERKARQPYLTWSRQGLLELTPGNCIDYRFIRERINALAGKYRIAEIAFDPYNATTLALQLKEEDGLEMREFRQGTLSMNEPMKLMMQFVLGEKIRHGGHKILRWNACNIAARKDASDNLRPDKQHSAEKIDGMVAAIMALACVASGRAGSVYDDPDKELMVI